MHRLILLIALLTALSIASVATASTPGPDDATIRVDPETQTVDPGDTFEIDIVQNAGVVTTGAQTNLEFDHGLLEVVSVTPGTAYTGASYLLGIAPQTKDEAIAEANNGGVLRNATVFFIPGAGSVPTGDAIVFTIEMRALQTGGTSDLKLTATEMLDASGDNIAVEGVDGSVVIGGATATPTPVDQTPTPTPTPVPTATPQPTLCPGCETTPSPTLSIVGELRVAPETQAVPPGGTFAVTLEYTSSVASTGAEADLSFDPALVEVIDIARGANYARALITFGEVPVDATPRPKEATIADANASGKLLNVATFFIPGSGEVPAGSGKFAVVTMRARSGVEGTSQLTLSGTEMLDADGGEVGVTAKNGSVEVKIGATGGITPAVLPASGGAIDESHSVPLTTVAVILIALIGVAGGAFNRTRRRI